MRRFVWAALYSLSGCAFLSGHFYEDCPGQEGSVLRCEESAAVVCVSGVAITQACDAGEVCIEVEGCVVIPSSSCGNGLIDVGEVCDDGNQVDDDDCSNLCQRNGQTCGDGIVESNEECEDSDDLNTDACLNDCTLARCGDFFIQ